MTGELGRFVEAQRRVYRTALEELHAGSKQSHWMWFIFPQLAGLGRSPTAQFFGIASADEARAYFEHSLLGPRLKECVEALLPWEGKRAAEEILGSVDAMKLRSSLTLFASVSDDPLFDCALDAFFAGERDQRTLELLGSA